jgi:hypothetical protein
MDDPFLREYTQRDMLLRPQRTGDWKRYTPIGFHMGRLGLTLAEYDANVGGKTAEEFKDAIQKLALNIETTPRGVAAGLRELAAAIPERYEKKDETTVTSPAADTMRARLLDAAERIEFSGDLGSYSNTFLPALGLAWAMVDDKNPEPVSAYEAWSRRTGLGASGAHFGSQGGQQWSDAAEDYFSRRNRQ